MGRRQCNHGCHFPRRLWGGSVVGARAPAAAAGGDDDDGTTGEEETFASTN